MRSKSISRPSEKLLLGTVIFEGYKLLDTYGPLELFLIFDDLFNSVVLASEAGEVKSSQGIRGVTDQAPRNCKGVDILLIPGGKGTRPFVHKEAFLKELTRLADSAKYVCSVCSGAGVLAKAGILDGRKATTNKAAWPWPTAQSNQVEWIPEARWVEDGRYFTSSSVSAGMDMSLALITKIYGREQALRSRRHRPRMKRAD